MTEQMHPVTMGTEVVAVGEVFPPAPPADREAKAGSTEVLKALHADLTATYREYLEMAKIKPTMLSPSMLGLIQQFLRHNEITAEAPQRAEMGALQGRLEQRRKVRENSRTHQNRINLNQAKRD